MMRKLFYLIIIFVVAIYLLIATTQGTKIIIFAINLFSPLLTYQQLEGNILDGIRFSKFRYESTFSKILVNKISFAANLSIKKRKIIITYFNITDALIITKETQRELKARKQPINNHHYSLYSILKHIVIDHLQIDHLIVKQNQHLYPIQSLSIKHHQSEKQIIYHLLLSPYEGYLEGDVVFKQNQDFSANLLAQHLNFSNNFSLPSNINFSLKTAGNLAFGEKFLQLQLNHLSGQWKKYLIKAEIDLALNNQLLKINMAEVKIGDNFIKFENKEADKNFQYIADLYIKQLSDFIPEMRANIRGRILIPDVFKRAHQLKADINLTNFVFKDNKIKSIKLSLLSHINQNDLRHDLALIIDQNAKIEGEFIQLDSNKMTSLDQTIKGHATIQISDLNKLIESKKIEKLAGRLQGEIFVSGKLNDPLFRAHLSLTKGNVLIKSTQTSLKNINANIAINNNKDMMIKAQFSAGKGEGNLNVTTNYQTFFPINLTLTGKNLRIINLKHYKIDLSPNLLAIITQDNINIHGEAILPSVYIKADNYFEVVELPEETVIINDPHAVVAPFFPQLTFNIKLILGDSISIKYKKLHATLGGDLTVTKILGALPVASGNLKILNGQYRLYNRLIHIETGRLIYIGTPLTNPGLDIKIMQPIDQQSADDASNLTLGSSYVGAHIQGTLDDPIIKFVSNPPMSQNEILANLIFGSSLSNLGGSQFAILQSLMSNFNFLTPIVGNSSSTFIPGLKFDILKGLSFKYSLSKHWLIQTKANMTETSGDLMYSYEH